MKEIAAWHIGDLMHMTLNGMLDGDFSAILLAQKNADNGAVLIPEGVAGDVVGDGEEDERVKHGVKLGALLGGEEGVRGVC